MPDNIYRYSPVCIHIQCLLLSFCNGVQQSLHKDGLYCGAFHLPVTINRTIAPAAAADGGMVYILPFMCL